jgi:homoserine kinase type II
MLTATDITQVLAHYDLGTLHSTISSCRGMVNETAFVQTNKGKFVVRRNSRSANVDMLRYRHQLITHLHENNVPTPRLLPTQAGSTLLDLDGRFYEVMNFVAGEALNPKRPQQFVNAGVTLALYHKAVENYKAPPDAARLRYAPQSLLALNEVLMKRDFFMGDLSSTLSWYDGRAGRLRKMLSEKSYGALPHLVIHGDIHLDNVLFAQDRVVALLDYDQVAWDTPVADLADALVAFASVDKPKVTHWGVFNGPLDEERAAKVIEGYASVRKLSRAEMDALPILLEVHWLQGAMGRVFSTPEGAPDYHLSVLDQGLSLSYWLNERRDRLIEHWKTIMEQTPHTGNRLTATAA